MSRIFSPMRLIDRYLLRQLLGPTLLATAALTAVALLSQSLELLDVIVNQRQSPLTFLEITLLYMPQLINMILPIALFVAGLVALNRLHTEQEIVVCFAGGMSRWRVISPAMRLAGTVAFIALLMNLWVQPACYRLLREKLYDVRADLAASLIREGEFTSPAPGFTIYAQSVDSQGNIKNIFINQEQPRHAPTTYIAEQGRIARQLGRPVLIMQNGSTQSFSDRGVLQYGTFSQYAFDLSPLASSDTEIHYKPSDRYLHELFFPDRSQPWEQSKKNRRSLFAEGHARLSTPLYNLAFMAMALSAIIGGGFSRLGYSKRIAITAAAAAVVRIIGFGSQYAAETNVWLNILQYAVPLIALAVALQGIFRQRARRFIDVRKPRPGAPLPAGAAA